ncbi:DnaJ sub C member 10 [Podila horticola]|nr:DnaJ sub C member 10 [Podila horticola]
MNLMQVGRAITANEFASWVAPILFRDWAMLRPAHQPVTTRIEDRAWNSVTHQASPGTRSIGIAVSGGVDSMALATLLSKHVQDRRDCLQRIQLHAMIVDHKLRDNSTEEASYVAEQIRRLDIHPHILTLDWSSQSLTLTNGNNKPGKAHLETLARLERYKVIAQQCRHLDIRQLFVGHHSGDQAETVLFRFSRASGIDGLAGIQPDAPFGVVNVQEALDLRVVRPLLSVSKVFILLNELHSV